MSKLKAERTDSRQSGATTVRLLLKAGIACAAFLMFGLSAIAQTFVTPGPNVNLIGATPSPDALEQYRIADVGLKQQQEPSCIVRPSNSAYIMCAYNDLRASDRPAVQGDSWIGYSESGDKGITWKSFLVPGFKSHPNSLNMGFAADPSLVAIPGSYAVEGDTNSFDTPGISVLNYIGANRNSSVGVLVVQRFVDNAQEDERHNLPEDGYYIIADGSSGRFIDKPAFLFVPDELGSQSYRQEDINVEGRQQPISVRTPTGTLVVAYAVFTGSSSTKVYVQTSKTNGVTWSNPTKLSESQNEVTGVSLSAIGDTVVATWRRKADTNEVDAIVSARAAKNLKNWTKAEVVFELCPIDQPATGVSFRSFAFPWLANDGNRFWTFAADRRFDSTGVENSSCDTVQGEGVPPGIYDGIPRIVGMSSPDGINWYGGDASNPDVPFVVDANKDSSGKPIGLQIMPSAIGTKGRIDLAWYDTRREELAGLPPQGAPGDPQIPWIYDYASTDFASLARVLRKADVWMTRFTGDCGQSGACTPSFAAGSPVRVSQYSVAFYDNPDGLYAVPLETEAHLPNHRLYASGTLAFKGDYIAIATPQLRKNSDGKWLSNSLPQQSSDLPTFTSTEDVFVAWGDNRDVRIDYEYLAGQGDPEQVPYTPPGGPAQNASAFKLGEIEEGASEPLVKIKPQLQAVTESDDSEDPNTPADNMLTCAPGQDFSRSRDSNIYGSVVADAPTLVAPTLTKPLGTIQRMFPLVLNNPDTTSAKDFCLVIGSQQPPGGRASFYQLPAIPPFDVGPPPLTRLPVTVGPGSTESRAIFVFAGADDVVRVDAHAGNALEGEIEDCADFGARQNSVFISDGSLLNSSYCETNPNESACLLDNPGDEVGQEFHNISLASLNLQAPVLKASVALNLQAPNLQAPALGALNLQALNLQALPPEVLAALNLQALNLQALNLQALNLQAPNLQALNLQAPNLQALNLQAPNLQAPNLQALNLQAPNLQAPSLEGDEPGMSPEQIEALEALEEAVVADDVYYQDITYVVNTNANVTTTYSADIALDVNSLKTNPDDEDPVVQLIAWTPNSVNSASPTTDSACGQPQTGFQAQVLAFKTLDALNLQAVTLPTTINPDVQDPYAGEISVTGKPGQKIALTVRIWASGGTKAKLDQKFGEWANCMQSYPQTPEGAAEAVDACSNSGVGQLISFGASSQSCASIDKIELDSNGDPIYDDSDCLNNDDEKIFQDRQPPDVDPVIPPEGFSPVPFELKPGTNELIITWPITATDEDFNNLQFACTINGADIGEPSTPTPLGDNKVSVTFSYSFPVGTTPVSCTVTDANENTATVTFDVTVLDTIPPTLTVPYPGGPSLNVEGNSVDGTASPDLGSFVLAEDNVAIASLSCSSTNNPLQFGANPVSCTAIDSSGNPTTADFTITVLDVFPPTLEVNTPIDDIELTAAGDIPADVMLENYVTARDNVGIASVMCSPTDGPLKVGPNPVSCTAIDLGGLSTPAIFTVNVVDVTPPELSVLADAVLINTDPLTGDIPDFDLTTNVTATDAVDDALSREITLSCTSVPAGPLAIGETIVTCTGTDDAGNTSEPVSYTINVVDGTPPTVIASDRTIYRDYVDPVYPFWASIDAAELAVGVTATDGGLDVAVNCSRDEPPEQIEPAADPSAPAPPILTDTDFEFVDGVDIDPDDPYSITCTAEDLSGNVGTASFLLTVSYLYDINLELPKKRARAGSTIPIDFDYREWIGGAPVDGSSIPVRVSWARFLDDDCVNRDLNMLEESSGLGEDSGNSDFRYSASSDTWQFSWQTPDLEGYYKLAISPPGKHVDNAWECVRLR